MLLIPLIGAKVILLIMNEICNNSTFLIKQILFDFSETAKDLPFSYDK